MRHYFVFAFLFALFLTGCANETAVPEKGDFAFELPAGYAVSDVTDRNCTILREADSLVVGGIELTQLNRRDLKADDSENIMLYLQNEFHMTNDVEYIAFHWGDEHPIVCINLTRHGDDGEKQEFSHTFFEKDSGVYHMWFHMEEMDPEAEKQFLSVTGVD